MAKSSDNGLAWFLAGVTVGIAGAILYAPQSGQETRESIGHAAREGRDRLEKSGREAADRGREFYEQGRRFANEATKSGRDALERGKQAVSKLQSEDDTADDVEEAVGV